MKIDFLGNKSSNSNISLGTESLDISGFDFDELDDSSQINIIEDETNKPNKPKKTKSSIINKFSLLQNTPEIQSDEVIDYSQNTVDATDFDFSFDETDKEIQENIINNDEEAAEANALMQKILAEDTISEQSTNEDDIVDMESDDGIDFDEEQSLEDEFDGIEIDTDDTISEQSTNDNDIEIDDSDFDIEDDSIENEDDGMSSIDDLDFEDDTSDEESESDYDPMSSIDNLDLDFEDEDESEETNNETQVQVSNNTEDDEDSFTLEDLDNIEEPSNKTHSTISQQITNSNNKSNEITIDLEDDSDLENELNDLQNELIIQDSANKIGTTPTSTNINQSTKQQNTDSKLKHEIESNNEKVLEMQQKIALMEQELQRLKGGGAKETASNIENNVNINDEVDKIDDLINGNKPKKENDIGKYDRYALMSTEALYKEVKQYMKKMGVSKRPIDQSALNNKFGETNIKKLIQKSYLIKAGKGVTTGR